MVGLAGWLEGGGDVVAFASVAGSAEADEALPVEAAAGFEWCGVVGGEASRAVGVVEVVGLAAAWAGGVGGLGLAGHAVAGAAVAAAASPAVGAGHRWCLPWPARRSPRACVVCRVLCEPRGG